MHRVSRILVMSSVCFALAGVVACVSAPRVIAVGTGHVAATHAVHNEHVASLMKSISRSHSRARSHRGPLVRARTRSYVALKEHASEIASFSEDLRGFADRESFMDEDRDLFLSFVDRLRECAGELENAADAQKEPKVKRAFAQLTATCNSCHAAFREQIRAHQ